MSDGAHKISGKCLCGAVSFKGDAANHDIAACHCKMCRRWSGGVFLVLDDVSNLSISGEDNMAVYQSSDWGERCFCKTCGTNLFWRMKDGSFIGVAAGAVDQDAELALKTEIFADHQPASYKFANDTQRLTEAEVLAKFSGASQQQD